MKRIIGILILGLIFGIISVSAQKNYCFKNDGLKVKQIVSLTVSGHKIEGTMESGGYDQDTSMETFDFTGTRAGNLLTIKFAGKPPYQLSPGTKKIVWTLGAGVLKIPIYVKNYQTKKYWTSLTSFETCKQQ